MAASLFLESLEIRGFRAFDHLTIERLGRVNLVVGKNNVGKSSLLEAMWLYAYQGRPTIVWQILEARDEGHGPTSMPSSRAEESVEKYWDIAKRLFHHDGKDDQGRKVQIGPVGLPEKALTVSLDTEYDNRTDEFLPVIRTHFEDRDEFYWLNTGSYRLRELGGDRCVMVSANGLDSVTVEKFWDSVSLTPFEEDVLNALRIIAQNIERINLVTGRRRRNERTPIVKVVGSDDPVPLRSLGEGMNRIFGVALALVCAKDGVLLIDEIESGLHYSVQPDIWRLIFKVANRLNVQVFATTHSWDCLTAFQEAAKEDEQDEGVLIRLLERKGKITTVQFDEDELEVVAREGIEVR